MDPLGAILARVGAILQAAFGHLAALESQQAQEAEGVLIFHRFGSVLSSAKRASRFGAALWR
eukprot:7381366-Pyramimonas_sp.AAC.1